MGKDNKSSDEDSKPTVAKTPIELQRFKLEKLMKNPDKPVVIPERVKEKKMPHVPEFVRNVMGSSAGAGSGEFHVYRHLRRKEYARQKFIQEKSEKQLLEEAYHQKLLDNKQAAEEKTAKKRAKRLRKKEKLKKKKLSGKTHENKNVSNQSQEESESESKSDSDSDKEHDHSRGRSTEVSDSGKNCSAKKMDLEENIPRQSKEVLRNSECNSFSDEEKSDKDVVHLSCGVQENIVGEVRKESVNDNSPKLSEVEEKETNTLL